MASVTALTSFSSVRSLREGQPTYTPHKECSVVSEAHRSILYSLTIISIFYSSSIQEDISGIIKFAIVSLESIAVIRKRSNNQRASGPIFFTSYWGSRYMMRCGNLFPMWPPASHSVCIYSSAKHARQTPSDNRARCSGFLSHAHPARLTKHPP